jgi:hypothetical protein
MVDLGSNRTYSQTARANAINVPKGKPTLPPPPLVELCCKVLASYIFRTYKSLSNIKGVWIKRSIYHKTYINLNKWGPINIIISRNIQEAYK